MSIIKGILGWFGGKSKNASTIINTAAEIIDKGSFTKEEKSDANMKRLELYLDLQKATAPQNVARREIAKIVVVLWGFLILVMIISHAVGAVEYAKFIFDTLKNIVMIPFEIIVGFYFLKHIVSSARK